MGTTTGTLMALVKDTIMDTVTEAANHTSIQLSGRKT